MRRRIRRRGSMGRRWRRRQRRGMAVSAVRGNIQRIVPHPWMGVQKRMIWSIRRIRMMRERKLRMRIRTLIVRRIISLMVKMNK